MADETTASIRIERVKTSDRGIKGTKGGRHRACYDVFVDDRLIDRFATKQEADAAAKNARRIEMRKHLPERTATNV